MTDSKKPETIRAIDCDEVMRQLFDYLDGEIDEKAGHEIHHHIDDCQSCFSRVEFEKALKDKIRAGKLETLPDTLRDRIADLMKDFSLDTVNEPGRDRE
ncbi:MAG: zf-HC2 domain-containing protein [Paracoccaceae bacterium]|nr:zf-HC2 domain-containing protein [Paracoccaceae bacterium]